MDGTAPQLPLADALAHAERFLKEGNKDAAGALYQDILAAAPDEPTALANLGILQCEGGDLASGVALLDRAAAADPGNVFLRNTLQEALLLRFNQALSQDDKDAAIDIARQLLIRDPGDTLMRGNLEGLLAYRERPACLRDFAPDLDPAVLGRTILIACMPKSGSSWLLSALLHMTGFKQGMFSSAYVENEQELFLPAVHKWARDDTVVQQHCRASAPNLHLIQAFGMTPVVLVRNIFDVLVSLNDFWNTGAVRNSFFYRDWPEMDDAARLDAIVDHVAPWYVQFYVSWQLAERKGDVRPLWVRYEDMMADKTGALERVAGFCGVDGPTEGLVEALERKRAETRFNKGVSGRGDATLTDAQKDRVRRLTRPFPSVDFSPVGL